MSAWIVTRDHVDLIVTAALSWEAAVPEHADHLGRMLWAENAASVADRYSDDGDGQPSGPAAFRDRDAGTYTFAIYPGRVDPDVVAIACDSLTYQSCEHPSWATSEARAWLVLLRKIARRHAPDYATRYGSIDPDRQRAGEHGWYWLVDQDGTRTVGSTEAWAIHDRDTFHRAAALREPPADRPTRARPTGQRGRRTRPTTDDTGL